MYPVLFPADATAFNSFGIGVLSDAISCEVEENRNGAYELEMRYPITGAFYDSLALRTIILAKPNYTDAPQPFRIYGISKPLNGVVTVNAQHISYDLSGYVDAPFTAIGVQAAIAQMLNADTITPAGCPFTFTSDMSGTGTMTLKHPESVRALMGGIAGSLIDNFGGEWHFDGYNCALNAARGANRGVVIRYGKNLTDLRQEENNEKVYTAVYPYYFAEETNALVTLPEKTISVSGTFPYVKVLPLDLSFEFEETPTEAQLRTRAERYITQNDIGVPDVNLTISFLETGEVSERVDLCDTVSVRFDALGVTATAKCIRTKWDVLKDRYIEAELGSARNSLAATIANTSEIAKVIDERTTPHFQAVAESVAGKVTGNLGGYIVLHDTNGDGEPDEILIMDHAEISDAVNLIRMNNAGIAFSQTGYNGTYTTAWNINGQFVADFIASGQLKTNQVTIFGDSNFTWNSANITLVDPSDTNKMIRFGKYDGSSYGLGFSVDGGVTWSSGISFDGLYLRNPNSSAGYARMDGDNFKINNDDGITITYVGMDDYCLDLDGNYVRSARYLLGTQLSGTDKGIYSFGGGRWSDTSGPYSVAIGHHAAAQKAYALALGYYPEAKEVSSIAIGNTAKASNDSGIAIGTNTSSKDKASIAIGEKSKAENPYSVAIGYSANATFNGEDAVAIGNTANASGEGAIAIGHLVTASYDDGIAIGAHSVTSGLYSICMGYNNTVDQDGIIAIGQSLRGETKTGGIVMGQSSEVTGRDAISIGYQCKASGNGSVAIGYQCTVTSDASFAIGRDLKATDVNQFVCGAHNSTATGYNFIIGNGTSSTKSYSFRVNKNGNATLAGTLTQNSDARQKDIIGEPPDLSGIHAIRYRWNDKKVNHDNQEHIGYIAQEVEKVAPYLVETDEETGYKSLEYIELLCAKIEQLERTVERLTKRVEELEVVKA